MASSMLRIMARDSARVVLQTLTCISVLRLSAAVLSTKRAVSPPNPCQVMYGFVALQPDGNTINGITYYDQGETPGLGGEIANPLWQQRFVGKKLYDEQNQLAIRIGKGASADAAHGIDGLSGATMTTKGVQGSFEYWFSQNGFGPYLAKIKAGE